MAKKKKKKHRRSKALSPQALERQAKKHLTTGRYRQAVDDYKALIKQDGDTYLPGLRAAYEGLYKQRLDKGMLTEAGMVLSQLEKLSGDSLCVESIPMWLKNREFAKAAKVAIAVLADGSQLPRPDIALAADALVTASEQVPSPQGLPDTVGDHLRRIQAALEAVAEEKYTQALAAIKPIGLQSIFFSWKCLLKGYCAFYRQEDSKALDAFKMIAAGTVPKAAAAPYVALLAPTAGGNGDDAKDTDLLEQICAVAGYPEMAPALARAEYLWRVGRFRDSHTHLLGALEHFPSLSPGLRRTLTELYYIACFDLPPEPARKYFQHLSRSAQANGNALAQFWASRSIALYLESQGQDEQILAQWEHFLELESSPYAGQPKVRALVYARLGDQFAEELPNDNPFGFFFSRRRRKAVELRNSDLAYYCYEKSLAADPGARETQLALIAYFEKINDNASVNRHLDRMIKQFPEEKDVLFKAGVRCMQRSALVKAMNYLSQALTLDPTDRAVREAYCLACVQAAHKYARKGKVAKSRALLPAVIAVADTHSDHFNLGRAYLYARWSAFEQLGGNDDEAGRLWQQALAHQEAGDFKVHFFYWIIAQYYGMPDRYTKKRLALIRKAMKGTADPDLATALADTLLYAQLLPEPIVGLDAKTDQFEKYIFRAAGKPMSRVQAKSIMAYALSEECGHPKIAKRCVGTMLKHHPEDAYFRYHRFLAQFQEAGYFNDIAKEMENLKTILQLAREQKENQVAAAAQKMLQELEEEVKSRERMETIDWDEPEAFDEDPDEPEMETMQEVFNALLKGSARKKKPSRKQPQEKKNEPKGPVQLELF
jgi:tetratricopeptide (TPR) repeat protein